MRKTVRNCPYCAVGISSGRERSPDNQADLSPFVLLIQHQHQQHPNSSAGQTDLEQNPAVDFKAFADAGLPAHQSNPTRFPNKNTQAERQI